MNILLVDDEALSVDGIAASLDWDALQISGVLKAYSMEQAQALFREKTVDIMVCDIEMPKGTGIELLEWVRANGYSTVCIFLTCYSKFEYASRAIQLQVFEYVLKPAEYALLQDTIARAAGQVAQEKENQAMQQRGEYWDDEYANIINEFWTQLVAGSIPADREKIENQLRIRHVPPALAEERYYLLLLQTLFMEEAKEWNRNLWECALQNITSEVLAQKATVFFDRDRTLLVIDAVAYPDVGAFHQACTQLLREHLNVLPAEFLAYHGEAAPMEEAARVFSSLEQDAQTRMASRSMVFVHGAAYPARLLPAIPEERWQNALLALNADAVADDIREFLFPVAKDLVIDRSLLELICHNLLSAIYYALEMNGLPAHQPFLDGGGEALNGAFRSVPDFEAWVHGVLSETILLIRDKADCPHLVETIRKYVNANLDGDLSRKALAGEVHLNPDYLSYLFREKSGVSLLEFITKERIKKAKQLLLITDLPVYEIAIRTGFQNSSYFSKQFKRIDGSRPLDYRKNKNRHV